MRFFKTYGVGLLALSVGTSVLAAAPAQGETVLQFNRWVPPTHFVQSDVLQPWADEVGQVTEGRVKVQVTASSLGPPPRQFDIVRDGVADIIWVPHGYTPERFQTSAGLELPFLGNYAESLSVAYWRTYPKHFAKLNEYEGTKLLSLHVHPPGDIFSNTRPLRNLEDLRGMKLRIPNPATARITERMGAVAVTAPAPKAYELLSRGVVDGTYFSADAIIAFKLDKHTNHHLQVDGGLYNSSFFLAMNRKSWESLDKRDQEAIGKISGENFAIRMGRKWDEMQAAGLKTLDEQGVTRTRVEGAMLEELKQKLGDADADWVKRMNERGVDGAAALAMIRSVAATYEMKK